MLILQENGLVLLKTKKNSSNQFCMKYCSKIENTELKKINFFKYATLRH